MVPTNDQPVLDQADREGSTTMPGSPTPWLLTHRVQIPELVAGYVSRPELERRCSPFDRQLTMLQAPGGFGKTALLAHCCSRLRDNGSTVAWLAVDEEDGPVAMATYLTVAFEQAGIATFDATDQSVDAFTTGRESDTQAGYRINLLIRAIERHGRPCLLALDELERLRNAQAVEVLNTLLSQSPGNLRFAMAFRERPPGLDIAMFLLEGRGETIAAEELRFSLPDIARFFDTELSRRELASVAASSAGWPIALRLYRNAARAGEPLDDPLGGKETVAAWIESRLWRGVPDDDRAFILDVSSFDWIDPDLIDEATGQRHSRRRIESMSSLAGLLQVTGSGKTTMKLHPLIREYCANKLFRENPARFRTVHAGIARGLARRGHIEDALRHAAEAGDAQLTGKIATDAGGVHIWIGRGFEALRGMDSWLTADAIAAYPRLALIRCVLLSLSGDMDGARRVYQETAIESAGFSRSPSGDEDPEMMRDHLIVLGLMLVLQCSPLPRYEPVVSTVAETALQPNTDPLLRGIIRYGLCLVMTERTEFERAAEWAERVRADLRQHTLYITPHLDCQLGLAAMAQGRTTEAAKRYSRALELARVGHLGNTDTAMVGELLMTELELERSARTPRRYTPVSLRLLGEWGTWFDVYAANAAIATELALHDQGIDRALTLLENSMDFARATERLALVTFLSALRVSVLAIGDRVEDAARAWRCDDLPLVDEECVNFKAYRWREVEALAEGRLRLLIAQAEFDAARRFASLAIEAINERRLVRARMRMLVLSMRLEVLAGDPERAREHLIGYLAAYAESDYLRPLARERGLTAPLLDDVVDSQAAPSIIDTAREVRNALATPAQPTPDPARPVLNPREIEVLQRLESQSDKMIAKDLNLSYDGVRYHVRRIFAKLGARGRFDAVHRARAQGILPAEGAEDSLNP